MVASSNQLLPHNAERDKVMEATLNKLEQIIYKNF